MCGVNPVRTKAERPQKARLARWAFLIVLLAVIGLVAWFAGSYLWASYNYRLAEQNLHRQDFESARKHLAVCLRIWPSDMQTCLLAARTARRARAYDEAAQLLRTYKKLGGVADAIELEQLLAQAQRGQMLGVEKKLLAAAKQDSPDATLIWEALAQGYIERYRWPHALVCVNKLLDRDPEDIGALLERGWIRENINQFGEAVDDFRHAVQLDSNNARARLSLAEVLMKASLYNDAVEHFQWLHQHDPEDIHILLGLARCDRYLGQLEEARSLLDGVNARRPNDAKCLAERGKVAFLEGQLEVAERWLRQSVALDPQAREANYDLYLCLQRMGKKEEAEQQKIKLKHIEEDIDRFQQLIQEYAKNPKNLRLACGIAEIMIRNRRKEAVDWLEGVLQQDPGFKDAHRLLADYYDGIGNSRLAEDHRKRAS
jgi:tetratricopeptide (TPR) repeat protein